jgi:glyoxylase-like metal-dependent hydrolase (beta-lactamase superfamily II)
MIPRTVLALGLIFFVLSAPPAAAQSPETSQVTRIVDGVYSFRHHFHRNFFVITDDGVIVTDPINEQAAGALMAAIKKLTAKPVKFVLYSHSHWDHIAGGAIFKQAGAKFIGHALIKPQGSGIIAPDITFNDSYTLKHGGDEIVMTYHGPNHGLGWVTMHLPKYRLLFIVDIVSPYRLPYGRIHDSTPKGVLRTLKIIEKLDFDRFVPGHGPPTAPKAAVTAHREYFEALYAAARAALKTYKDPAQAAARVRLPKYKTWQRYDRFLASNASRVIEELTTGK